MEGGRGGRERKRAQNRPTHGGKSKHTRDRLPLVRRYTQGNKIFLWLEGWNQFQKPCSACFSYYITNNNDCYFLLKSLQGTSIFKLPKGVTVPLMRNGLNRKDPDLRWTQAPHVTSNGMISEVTSPLRRGRELLHHHSKTSLPYLSSLPVARLVRWSRVTWSCW